MPIIEKLVDDFEDEIEIEIQTLGGTTPLMEAVNSGDVEVVAKCLNSSFSPFPKDCLGQTARDMAARFPNKDGTNMQKLIDLAIEQWNSQTDDIEVAVVECPSEHFSDFA